MSILSLKKVGKCGLRCRIGFISSFSLCPNLVRAGRVGWRGMEGRARVIGDSPSLRTSLLSRTLLRTPSFKIGKRRASCSKCTNIHRLSNKTNKLTTKADTFSKSILLSWNRSSKPKDRDSHCLTFSNRCISSKTHRRSKDSRALSWWLTLTKMCRKIYFSCCARLWICVWFQKGTILLSHSFCSLSYETWVQRQARLTRLVLWKGSSIDPRITWMSTNRSRSEWCFNRFIWQGSVKRESNRHGKV